MEGIEEVQAKPESVDTTNAPEFAMGRRKRAKRLLPNVTAPETPGKRTKTLGWEDKTQYRCIHTFKNGKVCNKVFSSQKGAPSLSFPL